MFDLKVRIWAIWEKVSAETQKLWIGKSRKGLVNGVSVDEAKRQVRVECVLKDTEIILPVQLERRPDWFRISVVCPMGMRICAVTNNGKILSPIVKDGRDGRKFKILFFRNATVIRCFKGQVSADYVGVRSEGGRFFLVQNSRVDLEIPRFIKKEGLSDFLSGKVPEDLKEVIVEIASYQIDESEFINQDWIEGLEKVKPSRNFEKFDKNRGRSEEKRGEEKPRRPRPRVELEDTRSYRLLKKRPVAEILKEG